MKIRSKSSLAAAVAAATLSLTVLASLPSPPARASAKCKGVQLWTATGLRRKVASHGPGTRFCLHAGVYHVRSTITLKSHDKLVGVAHRRDGVLVKTHTAEVIFDLHHTTGVHFRHFAITGAVNVCPESNCHPTGRAISEGSNVLIRKMHLYRNHSKAVGGAQDGLRIIKSEIDHNGAIAGDALSGGIKVTHSATIKDSYFHHNKNNAIWCDVHCGSFTVIGNRVKWNAGNGIFMEISQGPAKIANNIVKHNNTAHLGVHGGINITDSKDADIYGNTLGHNYGFGITARMDHRTNGWSISGVTIHGNVLNDDELLGCEAAGEVCWGNT